MPLVTPASVTVQRQTSVKQTLTVARVGAAPAKFADTTDMNLDEHVTGNIAGTNDTLTFSLSTSNGGANDAAGVSFNVPLPAYANIINYPATCQINGVAGAPASLYYTGTAGTSMTCTPTSITTAAGTSAGQIAAASNACSTSTSTNTSFDGKCFVVTFSLKFVDAASSATIVGNSAKAPVSFSAAAATGNDVDLGTTLASAVPPTLTVQRAAHLRLSAPIAVPTYADGVTSTGGVVAQGAFRANPLTLALTSGKVYNCFRYKVGVINDGPNYTNLASANYAIDLKNFVSTQTTVGTPATSAKINCAGASPSGPDLAGNTVQTKALGTLGYPSASVPNAETVTIDGFFDVGALSAANSGTATFQTQAFTAGDYSDSNLTATTAATPDYKGSNTLTVGNTPFNDATTQGFLIVPLGSTVPINIGFTQVDNAGVTSSASVTGINPAMPSGKSPYPPDAGATRALYQPGIHPTYYTVSSTATSVVASNPATVCILPGTAFADTFIKPERVLLWALSGAPAGTAFNTVPNIAAGDITTSVTSSGAAYVTAPSTPTFPQVPQAQPLQICGKLNGPPVASGTTLGLLEPVNFAPYVVGGTAIVAVQTGKGATTANSDAFINVSSSQTHDFNDKDPCYVGGARATCDDNNYLFAMTFGGGHTGTLPEVSVPALVKTLTPETSPTTSTNAYFVATGFNLGSNDQVYIAVFDQTTGADANNSDIKGSAAYPLTNPYSAQGDFLIVPYSSKTSFNLPGNKFPVCDPGTITAYYAISSTSCPRSTLLPAPPSTATTYAIAAGSGYQYGTVGFLSVLGTVSGGSGLVGLPYPDPSTPPTGSATNGAPYNPGGSQSAPLGVNSSTGATTAAIAYVTPGQTAGFQWGWLAGQATQGLAKGPSFGDVYTLGCVMVDLATQQTVSQPPAGITCTITTSTPTVAGATASPQSYTFQDTTATPYTGSAAPTIFVVTSGNQYAHNAPPFWQRETGGILLGLMVPLLIFRRKLGRAGVFLMALLTLAATPMLSGCGSGTTASTGIVAPTGSYLFRVTATPVTKPTNSTITSAPFEVVVQKAN